MASKDGIDDVVAPEDDIPRSPSTSMHGDMEGLSLYERKCILINHEIDSNGMGRYQWYIVSHNIMYMHMSKNSPTLANRQLQWGLCGFGYLLDLLWAQAFGLVLQPLMQEMGFPGDFYSCSRYVSQSSDYLH